MRFCNFVFDQKEPDSYKKTGAYFRKAVFAKNKCRSPQLLHFGLLWLIGI